MSYLSQAKKTNPIGLTGAIAINGSVIAAIMLSPVVVEEIIRTKDPIVKNIPINRPPPPEPTAETPQKPVITAAYKPPPIVKISQTNADQPIITEIIPPTLPPPTGELGKAPKVAVVDIKKVIPVPPVPIFKAAMRDSRYARHFQPAYPRGRLISGDEGFVKIRVLIGTDGRVRQADIVSATHPDFGRATKKQALRKWRFKPATRGGKPVEDWQTLTVRFDIT